MSFVTRAIKLIKNYATKTFELFPCYDSQIVYNPEMTVFFLFSLQFALQTFGAKNVVTAIELCDLEISETIIHTSVQLKIKIFDESYFQL